MGELINFDQYLVGGGKQNKTVSTSNTGVKFCLEETALFYVAYTFNEKTLRLHVILKLQPRLDLINWRVASIKKPLKPQLLSSFFFFPLQRGYLTRTSTLIGNCLAILQDAELLR